MIKTNYLIIGSGVAGLTFAIKIANQFPDKKITIADGNEKSFRESFALIVFGDDLFYGISKITSTPLTAVLADRPLNTNLDLAKSVVGRFMLNKDKTNA